MKIENNRDNSAKCSCKICPSYGDCAKEKNENLFCANGTGPCVFKTNGCPCNSCPVHKENRLKANYYCINGSAEQTG